MAITATTYELLRALPVQRGMRMLEVGEANWYGDISPASVGLSESYSWFDVAKAFYRQWCEPSECVAIDMNGSEAALRLDLNTIDTIGQTFGIVINHGTAEHIFNIANVFRLMHDHCEVDGWMIHDAPLKGWIDHGFYCLQPTLFYDIAGANNYEIASVAIHECKTRRIVPIHSREYIADIAQYIPDGAMLFVALRKRMEQPFRIPAQGYYARTISQKSAEAWSNR